MKKFITALALASTGLIVAGSVMAAEKTANFKVKIKIESTCSITATDINFGTVNSNASVANQSGNLSVVCTNQTPYSIGLAGSGKMTHATDSTASIDYQLFKNSTDTAQWTNDSATRYTANGSGTTQTIPVLAKVTGSTNVRAGDYSDTVTATVYY